MILRCRCGLQAAANAMVAWQWEETGAIEFGINGNIYSASREGRRHWERTFAWAKLFPNVSSSSFGDERKRTRDSADGMGGC